MSSFKSLDLFGSGPHRFSLGPRGQLVTIDFFGGGSGGGSTAQGLIDAIITVRGRLVASTESALLTLRNAVFAQLQATPTPGTLIDNHAHSWTGMSFVRYAESGPTDRGRVWSIAYEATFQAL
ncbi:hypothetical protein PHYC_00310 [Phycisphaerales bacterium]|nr:hypothetical protein PHYC_00310 [Phycisphaerales bacterium]